MHDIEGFATSSVEELLSADDMLMSQVDSLKVSSRVKQPYSLWKKLLKRRTRGTANGGGRRKELSVQNLGDAVALRVVLRAKRLSPAETDGTIATREAILCYYVQNLIMQKFPARDESTVKDYISSPKPNGYQSLHHTADLFRNGVDWLFEVQVRSEEMHRLAEFGVAAHWDYKIQGQMVPVNTVVSSPGIISSDSDDGPQNETFEAGDGIEEGESIKELIDGVLDANLAEEEDAEDDENDAERSDRCSSYIEALTSAREEIKANKVFVFISSTASANDGKILPLSLGATVADALSKAEDRYGMHLGESKLLCNGQEISMEDELKNGDVVVIASQ
jgi:(p)ppGpp synthase/HD superfamily hydrolase